MFFPMLIISFFILIFAIVFLSGKGSDFIAGYNTLSAEEKDKYNVSEIVQILGIIFALLSCSIFLLGLSDLLQLEWLEITSVISIFVIIFVSLLIPSKKETQE